ncbi:DUF3105 domain-containing protein [Streptomyces bobili]|uniref:DUF3105 domain-containing protein n=1 Tax=Streptomyces bobili TaxID=67280 RepID=UPI0033A022F4
MTGAALSAVLLRSRSASCTGTGEPFLSPARTISTVILVGWGAHAINDASEKDARQTAAAKRPVNGEKSWDAGKLGRNHVEAAFTCPMNPPVGGDHHQAWMTCEGTVCTKAVPDENAVRWLEHGAVWVTYNDTAVDADVEQLAGRVSKTPYTLMSPNPDQSGPIMLSAWGHQLGVDTVADPRIDQFIIKYVQAVQTPEPGAACSGGPTV